MNSLAVTLTQSQIKAASLLYKNCLIWQRSEEALDVLEEKLPGYSDLVMLLKVVAVNGLYGTHLLAVSRMADHIKEVLAKNGQLLTEPDLVEEIALLPGDNGKAPTRRYHSFASKFAHFFIDSERFPIMDSYAVEMVRYHLGAGNDKRDPERPYKAFVENLSQLKSLARLDVGNRELDRYLWITGGYRTFRKRKPVNVELEQLFKSPSDSLKDALETL